MVAVYKEKFVMLTNGSWVQKRAVGAVIQPIKVKAVVDPAAPGELDIIVLGTTNQITVTDNGDGTYTLSTPQDIGTTSIPTFAGIKGKNRVKQYFYAGF